MGLIEGDTRSLDYSTHIYIYIYIYIHIDMHMYMCA